MTAKHIAFEVPLKTIKHEKINLVFSICLKNVFLMDAQIPVNGMLLPIQVLHTPQTAYQRQPAV